MKTSSDTLHGLVGEIRRRRIIRSLKQGSAITILTFLFFATCWLLVNYRFDLSPGLQTIGIIAAGIVLLAEIVQLVIRPMFQRADNRRIALFIEEKFPELEDSINSAVELDAFTALHEKNILIDRLMDDAARKARAVSVSVLIDRKKERILTCAAYGLLFLFLVFSVFFKSSLDTATSKIRLTSHPFAASPQGFVSIMPGNIQIEKGESREIIVELAKKASGNVVLHYTAGGGDRRSETMEKGIDKPLYLFQIPDIQEPVEYYVTVETLVSPRFAISVYEFPKVVRIDARYIFPAYTGLTDRIEEDAGDLRGLKGSEVVLTLRTSGTAETGELRLSDSRKIPLKPLGDGVFRGKITLDDFGTYAIHLTDREQKNNKFPEEYRITPVEDELPVIAITEPKRDIRVNPVEEVSLAASVTDDYGVAGVRMKYMVNGGEEQTVSLAGKTSPGAKSVSGAHVFYLENLSLEPGDIISYFVEAEDTFHKGNPAATDMYFIEVAPFDINYTQVNNQQDGGGQQSGQRNGSQMVMSQQMIIAATWKLYRLRNEKTPAEYSESLEALIQAQENLRDNIVNRIAATALSLEMALDEDYKEIVKYLRAAVDEMNQAVAILREKKLMDALKPEQRALNNLLKADAKNREKRVRMSRQQNRSGGGMNASSEERMTELMDLELDISKDKYEIQRQEQNQPDRQVDDALEKIRELARKQQSLASRNRNEMQREEETRRFLDRLQRDQEELRKEAGNLTNAMRNMTRDNPQMSRQMQEQAQRIAEAMRQAEQEMQRGNIQGAQSRQKQALNELNRLQQDLRVSRTGDPRDRVNELASNFEQLREQEKQFAQNLRETAAETRKNNGKAPDPGRLQDLAEKRESLRNDLNTLENQARSIEQQTEQKDPETASGMRNIRNTIRGANLEGNMEELAKLLRNGWINNALTREESIQSGLDSLGVQIGMLERGSPDAKEEQVSRSLRDVREIRRGMEEALARARQNQPPQSERNPGRRDNQSPGERSGRQNSGNGGNTAREMQGLVDRFNQLLERMEREYAEDPGMRHTVENARHASAPRITGELLDNKAPERFRESIFRSLSQIEIQLLKHLNASEQKKLYSTGKPEVPREYQAMVEKYFESLAKTRK